jgi:branched-chain amino acid aminotransferase
MPIRSLDKILIGHGETVGKRGPITKLLQAQYQDIINGRAEDVYGWMSWRER